MTIAADRFGHPDRVGTVRWSVSLLVILALHGGLVLVTMLQHAPVQPVGMPPAAVMIDLAPLPTAAPAEPTRPRAEPQGQTPPPEPEPEPQPAPQPEAPKLAPSPPPHRAVTLPAPQPPKPKPKVKRTEHPPLRRQDAKTAPPAPLPAPPMSTPPAATAQPSAPPSVARSVASSRATWQAQLVAWLEKYKRYPRVAQEQRQQGVVYLHFAINRQGAILSSRITKSSGFELLDDEVLALVQRAQPLPAPPTEVSGERIELVVPVAFSLRR